VHAPRHKLENIVTSAEPLREVIADFGAATRSPTSNDHLKGTIRYLAPEIMGLNQTAPHGSVYDRGSAMEHGTYGLRIPLRLALAKRMHPEACA
jgi:hypothetical protein